MPIKTQIPKFPTPHWQDDKSRARVYVGDFMEVQRYLPRRAFDLVFADPPFNIGYSYDKYDDKKDWMQYLTWTRGWLSACKLLLKPTGTIYVAIHLSYMAEVRQMMDIVGFNWRDTIAWHYTFGPAQKGKFTPSWVPIHYATASPDEWVWNEAEVRVPSARQLKYGDKRANSNGKLPDNVWVLHPDAYNTHFPPGGNMMLESRVCGTFKERTTHPCQMPEAVLDRIIRVSSKPGGLILDPFLGSGTTMATALKLNRRCVGVELSDNYVDNIVKPRVYSVLGKQKCQ